MQTTLSRSYSRARKANNVLIGRLNFRTPGPSDPTSSAAPRRPVFRATPAPRLSRLLHPCLIAREYIDTGRAIIKKRPTPSPYSPSLPLCGHFSLDWFHIGVVDRFSFYTCIIDEFLFKFTRYNTLIHHGSMTFELRTTISTSLLAIGRTGHARNSPHVFFCAEKLFCLFASYMSTCKVLDRRVPFRPHPPLCSRQCPPLQSSLVYIPIPMPTSLLLH